MFDAAPDPAPPLPLAQSPGFARALRATGGSPLVLPDDTLVLRRRWGLLTTHMLVRADVTPGRLRLLREAGCRGPAILSPEVRPDPALLPIVPLVSPVTLATVDLSPDPDHLQARMHQKWRNRLRHGQRQGLRITRQNMPDQPDHWLLQADEALQAGRGYRTWPAALTCAFARENKGDAKLFTAYQGKKPVAGLLVLRHGAGATYHVAHTHPLGRLLSAQPLLLWEAMCWLKRKGAQSFDLGPIDTEQAAGLARFKLGAGATARRLGGTWGWWPPLTRIARPLSGWDRKLMQSG